MVSDVVVADIVQEESPNPAQKRPVNGGDRATEESPSILAEVGHCGIGVVQIGKHHDPVVCEQVWDGVVLHNVGERRRLDPLVDDCAHRNETDVGQEDLEALLFLE